MNKLSYYSQRGFTLIELMVGLVIGLIATLAIVQTMGAFEGQKRATVGSADAQVNGSIAMYNIQRQVQMAGYGLPIFDASAQQNNSPLKCSPSTIDHDANGATARVEIFPISLTNGGTATASDMITINYFQTSASGGLPTNVISVTGSILGVDNTLGCAQNDIALVVRGTSCLAGIVGTTNATLATTTTNVTLTGPDVASMSAPARLTCLGGMNTVSFAINASNELTMNGTAVISDIVNMQAQYGVSATSNSNVITSWVDATAATGFAAPTIADRNRIRAIRVALVARNSLLEKTNVTTAAPIAWVPVVTTPASPAPTIDLSNTANWQRYRYRTYETVIPLRNLTWSGQWL
jgi:type IV pilus assembly protein PilW